MSFHIIFVVFSLFLDIVEAGTVTTISSTSWPVGSDVTFEWSYTNGARQTLGEIQFGVRDDDKRVVQILQVQVSKSEPVTETTLSPPWTWYQGRVTWTGSVSNKKIAFKLTKAALNDSRTFSCYVEWSGVYEVKTIDVTILITASPTVIQPAVDSHYTKGNKVNITCNTTGIPTPSVHWFRGRDSHEYPASTGASYLVFDPIGKEDAGNYKCKATNSVGNNETTVDIVVYYKPETTTLSNNATGSGSVAVVGEYILLKCEVPVVAAKPAASHFKFYHVPSSKLLQSSPSREYVIPNIQYSDRGQYKCVATNSAGDGPDGFSDITVQEPAKIRSPSNYVVSKVEGKPVPLVCVATGHPPPTVTWIRDGRTVGVKGNATIVKSTRDDSGDYTCTASNTVRGVSKTSTITITVKIMYTPEVDTGLSNGTVGSWDNNVITLQCVARGVPAPTFSWFKPEDKNIANNIVPISDGSRVTVTTSAPGDYGQYKCRATNAVGSTDYNITVNHWTKPGKPLEVTLKEIQASYVKLAWVPPANDGGSRVIDYKIEIQKNTDAKPKVFDDKVTGTERLVDQLTPGASYSTWVYARNIVGFGDAALEPFTTKKQGKPGISMLKNTTKKISTTEIELTWAAAAENGGKILTYTVWWRVVETNGAFGKWVSRNTSSNAVTYTVTELKFGRIYQFGITAWNKFGRSALDKENGLIQVEVIEPTAIPPSTPGKSKGVDAAAIGGGVAAAIIIILVVVVVIVVLKESRKASPGKAGESRDPLGDEGYSSVTNASAARRLGRTNASNEAAGIPTYATVDMSKKTPKKPDLIYAELADFDNSAARAASMNRRQQPKRYEPTDYAEIAQFGRPSAEPMYDNVPRY